MIAEIIGFIGLWFCIIALWIRVYLSEKKIVELKNRIDKS